MPRWRWILSRLTRRLWVRATLIGALGVLAALLATVADRAVPWRLPIDMGADAVDSILTILASSMLAVTTFSLSVMTSAFGSATSNVTPRATRLMVEDQVTQNALSTFLGSFLFSIVGIVVLKTGAYGEQGRAVLFAVTIAVIALIVVALLRWIDHLTRFGRVVYTTEQVEGAARLALEAQREAPCLGGTPLADADAVPAAARPVTAATVGYLQHVDMAALSEVTGAGDADVYVAVLPGAFVYVDTPIAWIDAPEADAEGREAAVRKAFSIAGERSFEQDPRFGLVVLGEIASRALSPGVNDPGTAIDVIGRLTRLLTLWAEGAARDGDAGAEVAHPRVHVPRLRTADLFEDGFMAIARDGAGMLEVQLRLGKALAALGRIGDTEFRTAAHAHAALARKRAAAALSLPEDRERLQSEDGG